MPMRDRLEELHTKQKLLEMKPGKGSSKMEGSFQDFLVDVGQIESGVAKMKEDLSAIKKLQKNMFANTPFYDEFKNSVIKYESMSEQIRHDATKISGALKELDKKYEISNSSDSSSTTRARIDKFNALTTEHNATTNEFFKSQTDYMDQMKSRLRKQHVALGDNSGDDSKINAILEKDSYSVFTDNFVTETQDAASTLRDLEERKDDILKLEKGVTEVNQLFKDMNLLVSNQGETITTIEQAMESTAVHVEGGKKQLHEANEYRARARRRMFCIFIVILIFLVIVGIILAIIFAG